MPYLDLSRAVWRKSSRSNQNGACVEVAGLSRAAWRKSSRSTQNGECVEVTGSLPNVIAVRDSKDPHGRVLTVGPAGWRTFIADVKAGQHDFQ